LLFHLFVLHPARRFKYSGYAEAPGLGNGMLSAAASEPPEESATPVKYRTYPKTVHLSMIKLTDGQPEWLAERISDHELSPNGGRPPADKGWVMQGIFWILDNGAKWGDLPQRFGAKSTVRRWFQIWTHAGAFEEINQPGSRTAAARVAGQNSWCHPDANQRKLAALDGAGRLSSDQSEHWARVDKTGPDSDLQPDQVWGHTGSQHLLVLRPSLTPCALPAQEEK
jgi:transposase